MLWEQLALQKIISAPVFKKQIHLVERHRPRETYNRNILELKIVGRRL